MDLPNLVGQLALGPLDRGPLEPGRWPDLDDAQCRAELTPAAVKAMAALADAWGLSTGQVCDLLGSVPSSSWHVWVVQPPEELSVDQLTRVSLLLGIAVALRALHPGALADQWPTRPNSHRLFGGRTPLEVMTAGGVPVMVQVAALLDGRVGGG